MNFFDDEPGPGRGYERSFSIALWDRDAIPRRIVVRDRNRFERVAVVLEEMRSGELGHLMRYDDAHGRFHRHEPGWPQPAGIAVYLDGIPTRLRAAAATEETKERYTTWEAEVFSPKGTAL